MPTPTSDMQIADIWKTVFEGQKSHIAWHPGVDQRGLKRSSQKLLHITGCRQASYLQKWSVSTLTKTFVSSPVPAN